MFYTAIYQTVIYVRQNVALCGNGLITCRFFSVGLKVNLLSRTNALTIHFMVDVFTIFRFIDAHIRYKLQVAG